MRTIGLLVGLLTVLALSGAMAQDAPVINNPGFELWQPGGVDSQGLVVGWTPAAGNVVPTGWVLNSAYVGTLSKVEDGAPEGKVALGLTRGPKGSSHIYQMLKGLKPGQWYRFQARLRGGNLGVYMYQYFQTGPMNTVTIAQATPSKAWREVTGYYQTPTANWGEGALALTAEGADPVIVDDVRLTPINVPQPAADAPNIVLENSATRVELTPTGTLGKLVDKASGQEYQLSGPMPVLTATVVDNVLGAWGLTQQGDKLTFRFAEENVRVVLQVASGAKHFRFKVVEAVPADMKEVRLQFPVKRLAKIGGAFGATYDDSFGLSFTGTTPDTHNLIAHQGGTGVALTVACGSRHGVVGGGAALVAAPAAQFRAGMMEMEKAAGLPCPMLGGKWARDSESNRKSYLFAAPAKAEDVDALIDYAKLGGFGTIIFLKDSWLANHGHFDINTDSFPGGLSTVRAAVDKIHRAGLEAGVHVFGPSISPNDRYVTPVPDKRLAHYPCPPLAEAMDEKSTTVTFTEAPNLPPRTWDYQGFPGHYLRLGDEIISYQPKLSQEGPPFRYMSVQRGALGTKVTAHPAGTPINGLPAMWGFFLVDPDSTLADELTTNFARVFNACDFDFAYFDASDGCGGPYMDTMYYLNTMHLAYYRKFKRDVLYQTSMGTGSGLVWHIVPRSASADGHGDLKGYLDERWPGILGMGDNWTKSDVGWYYWFQNCRPDQFEYICAKVLGIDGSISLETSKQALEGLPQSRQMMEMLGRWQRCRQARVFGEDVRAKLREPKKDFKLFPDGKNWKLYRAAYEDPRSIDVLDGRQNTWTITNDRAEPCLLGVEIVRSLREVALQSYEGAAAKPLDLFTDAAAYRHVGDNRYEKYVEGAEKVVSAEGVVRKGVSHSFEIGATAGRGGGPALVYSAENKGDENGWCGIGRRFAPAMDLSAYRGLGVWINGDGHGESVRIQFRDVAGKYADWVPRVDFTGWRLHTFTFPTTGGFDWTKVEYFLVYFNGLPSGDPVKVTLDDLRVVPAVTPPNMAGGPGIRVNGRRVTFDVALNPGDSLTHEGLGTAMLWPRGMAPGKPLNVRGLPLVLQPGENKVEFTWAPPAAFPGGVDVVLYRLWPLETTP